MSNKPIDPRYDKLIAALYGELSPEEERAFLAELETDSALKAEWEALNETRAFVAAARTEENAFEYAPESETASSVTRDSISGD